MEVRLSHRIDEIDPARWDAVVGRDYPFLRHPFLQALEASGAVSVETGWQPLHLTLWEQERLLGLMPLYLKSHSYGEYVFDWSWADAYRRHGLDYYPKLVTAIPFTPASGPRLRLADGLDSAEAIGRVSMTLHNLAERLGASSWHGLFFEPAQLPHWLDQGHLLRKGCQFHWHNPGFRDFADFLDGFNSRKRKAVRRERRLVEEQGVHLERLTGDQVSEALWQRFYACYQSTYRQRGQRGYLNLDFFLRLAQQMGESLLLVVARREAEVVAAALSLHDDETLYGRHWGALEQHDQLHFEACYYQGIEFCIERGLKRFDPGTQGEHKIQRGFAPVETHSLHWIADGRFRRAIADFVAEEALGIDRYRQQAATLLPFRQGD